MTSTPTGEPLYLTQFRLVLRLRLAPLALNRLRLGLKSSILNVFD